MIKVTQIWLLAFPSLATATSVSLHHSFIKWRLNGSDRDSSILITFQVGYIGLKFFTEMDGQKRSHHFVSHFGLLTSHHLSSYSGGIQGAS